MSLEKLRTAHKVAGLHQVCRAVQSGAAEMVFIASDVDDAVKKGSCRTARQRRPSSVIGRVSM